VGRKSTSIVVTQALIWSRYNYTFESEKYGFFVYNSLSNKLMLLDPGLAEVLPEIKKDPETFDFSRRLQPFMEMIKNKVLITRQAEEDFIEIMKFSKTAARFDSSGMALTLLVTEHCNFSCPYCYEHIRNPAHMSDEVIERLILFIKRFLPLKSIFITWFGGEPLLRPDIISKANSRIRSLGVDISSMIVTNGWLLTGKICGMLDELNCRTLQVTIDGPRHLHNKTRVHSTKGDTFDVIQTNLDRLMLEKKWPGRLIIHYNIDSHNAEHYSETYKYWKTRYPDSDLVMGRNFVNRQERAGACSACSFSRRQETDYYLESYEKDGAPGLDYYPRRHGPGCIATKRNGFVVGAKGQVYKCWHDIGVKEREIGSLFTPSKDWNWTVISRYMTGVEPFDMPECRDCFLLPVCEECPHMWYRKKYMGQEDVLCARYKEQLDRFLEIHYERSLN
jgi:uncharacterized protein